MDLFVALLPALIMIVLVITTRKVLLSLGTGIVIGSLILNGFNIMDSISYIISSFMGIITDFEWSMAIVGFLLLLGVIASFLTISGGTKAFADWAVSKIHNEKIAQLVAWLLGMLIFIDDYFNALVIGEISKPITDRYSISRAKLSYIIDSTSAPVVILLPISTWGAYVIGILQNDVLGAHNINYFNGTEAFWRMVPLQFYAITALLMVVLTIIFKLDFGPMKKYEESARNGHDLSKTSQNLDNEFGDSNVPNGTPVALITTILTLIFTVFFVMYVKADFNFGDILSVDITIPLFISSVIATLVSLVFVLKNKAVKRNIIPKAFVKGVKSMMGASLILIFAWMVSGNIKDLKTGELIASYITNSNISIVFLPAIIFIVSAFIAFTTGSSWATFGILLPIGGAIIAGAEPTLILGTCAAILSGSILGDHCSPISDTTVLSATGAQSTLDAHFTSQMPYAVVAGVIAFLSFLSYGITQNLLLSYSIIASGLALYVIIVKKFA